MAKRDELEAAHARVKAKKEKLQAETQRKAKRASDLPDKQAVNAMAQQYNELLTEQLRLEREIANEAGDTAAAARAQVKINNVQLNNEKLEKQGQILKANMGMQEQMNGLADGLASRFGIGNSAISTQFKLLKKNFLVLKDAHEEAGKMHPELSASADMAKRLVKALTDAFSPMNILTSLASGVWKASLELFTRTSKAIAGFNAAVGDLGTSARAVGQAMDLSLGVNIEHAARAATGLANSFTSFTSLTLPLQKSLITTSAALERVGQSAQVSGDMMSYFTQAAGMSLPKAEKQMKELAVSAHAFGKPVGQFGSEFLAASKTLSAHGPKMMDVFLDLQSVAKASGMAINDLMSIANKFDTFDSAASSVGNLNALLGGDYLNTLEMMNMTEKERVESVKRSLEMNGKSFDQMERFERKAIAESMGTDEANLAKMMGYSTRESRKAAREAKRKAKEQKSYNKMVRQTVDIMESLSNLFQSVFAKTGLMKAFGGAFNQLFAHMKPGSPLGDMVRRVTGALGDLMSTVIEAGVPWLLKFADGGSKVVDWIMDIGVAVQEFFTNTDTKNEEGGFLSGITSMFTTGATSMTETIKGPTFDPVRKAIKDMFMDPVSDAMLDMGQAMKDNASDGMWGTQWIQEAVGNLVQSAGKGLKKNALKMKTGTEKALVDPFQYSIEKIEDKLKSSAESGKFKAIGQSIVKGFDAGMDPEALTKSMDGIVGATNEWADALNRVAAAAKNVGAAEISNPAAGGAAGAVGNGAKIVLEIDGDTLGEYIIDTVKGTAKRISYGVL